MRANPPDRGSRHDTSVPLEGSSVTDHTGLSRADDHFGFGTSTPSAARGGGVLAAGTSLDGVTIIRLIAEGGMGRVYEGRQAAPERAVAVKVLRGGFASASLVRRFEYEARVLARLRHPTIAQIFTFGTYDDGDGVVPFFVMEMIDGGRPITRHALEAGPGVREIVTVFRRVCAAVAHGHQKGVIHRDLKPGNILVDAGGEPKVIDFGVARSIEPDHGDPTQMTRAGDVVGTLRYMSPEQLGVGDGDVDARSDVYALGLVLHEVLTGSLPYDLRGMSFVEAARILDDPSPTSTTAVERVARAAGCGALDSRALATIIGTCLEKRPADRYATAVEVEAELGRWLAGEAILARPPTPGESLVRFARRHRAATAAAVAILASLVAAISGISFFYVRAEQDRQRADAARLVAVRREEEAEHQAAAARAQLYISNVLLAAAARDRDNVSEAKRLLADARGLVADAGTANPIELNCLAASLDESVAAIGGHAGNVTAVGWSRDGTTLASGASDGAVRLGTRTGEAVAWNEVPIGDHDDAVWSVAFAPDGGVLATVSGDGTVRVWDAEATIAPVMRGDGKVLSVCFAADGQTIATAMANSAVCLWDAATLQPRGVLRKAVGRVNDVRFSPDGETVAGCCDDGSVQLWDRGTRQRRDWFKPHERRIYALDFSPDGRLVATAAEDRSARISDLASGTRVGEPLKHGSRVFRATFSPDGSLLATACEDRTARLWRVADGSEVRRFTQHEGPVNWVAFSNDGTMLVTACSDGAARAWNVADGGLVSVMTGPSRQIWKAAFSPDGCRVAGVSADGTAQVWDVATGRAMPVLRGHGDQVWGVAFAPDGRSLVTGSWDGTARVWGVSVAEIARRRMQALER